MSDKNHELSQEEISDLAKSLDLSVEELTDILKSADDVQDIQKSEGKESEEEEVKENEGKESEEEEVEKSLMNDISSKLKELNELRKSKAGHDIQKSEKEDLMKSFGDFKEDLMKSIGDYKEEVSSLKSENEDLKKSIDTMKETLDTIASNSQGTKGMRVKMSNVIEKSEEVDGKVYMDSKDKRGILKAMDAVISKSKDEDLVKSMEDDMVQLETTGEITKGALYRLNQNNIFMKEQMEQ